jgi:hypothetical protein
VFDFELSTDEMREMSALTRLNSRLITNSLVPVWD